MHRKRVKESYFQRRMRALETSRDKSDVSVGYYKATKLDQYTLQNNQTYRS